MSASPASFNPKELSRHTVEKGDGLFVTRMVWFKQDVPIPEQKLNYCEVFFCSEIIIHSKMGRTLTLVVRTTTEGEVIMKSFAVCKSTLRWTPQLLETRLVVWWNQSWGVCLEWSWLPLKEEGGSWSTGVTSSSVVAEETGAFHKTDDTMQKERDLETLKQHLKTLAMS